MGIGLDFKLSHYNTKINIISTQTSYQVYCALMPVFEFGLLLDIKNCLDIGLLNIQYQFTAVSPSKILNTRNKLYVLIIEKR